MNPKYTHPELQLRIGAPLADARGSDRSRDRQGVVLPTYETVFNKSCTKEAARTGVRIPKAGIGAWNYHARPAPLRRGLEADRSAAQIAIDCRLSKGAMVPQRLRVTDPQDY